MREYDARAIRNVAVVGHGASGKTTLVDSLAFISGSSRRRGSVKEGTALTDATPEEIERGYSINVGCAIAEWMDTKLNLLDAPGYADFAGDAIAGLAAADGALVAVSATSGVEVGTERMFHEAIERRDPVLFVVTMMDKEHASFDKAYAAIRETLTPNVIPVEIPLGEGAGFRGAINLFSKRACLYGAKGSSDIDIPAEERERFERYHKEMLETIASTDDSLLERYLDGGEITRDEEVAAMKEGMKKGQLFPLFCCAAERDFGTETVLTRLVELMPSAYEMEELHGFHGAEGEREVEIHPEDGAPFVAQVFKTLSEPHVGDISFFRILSGTVENGSEVFNASRGAAEKLGHLSVAQGRERMEVQRLHAGDVGCVAKLRNTHTGDTLSTREHPVRLPSMRLPEPLVTFAIHAASRTDDEKLQAGLHRLHDEDPTLELSYNPETHETLVSGLGERHLDVALAKLRRKAGVAATLGAPKIAYRETIRARAEGQGRHKKQTGGRGQFGDCWVRIAPAQRGDGVVFEDRITGGVIPSKFIPAVEKGINEAATRGVLAGYPMVDFRVELFDGSYHSVDSNEMSFKMAGILAFKEVAKKCRPVLLEPLDELEIETPDDYLGDVLGDLSSRRGQVLGTEPAGAKRTRVRATVPESEIHLYATQLQSLTHGRAKFTRRFKQYEEVPGEVAQRVIAQHAEEKEATA
ncbi:MAG TPA: elongation factor G [Gemmatimonadaceae bacterium]